MKTLSKPLKIIGLVLYAALIVAAIVLGIISRVFFWGVTLLPLLIFCGPSVVQALCLVDTSPSLSKTTVAQSVLLFKILLIVLFELFWISLVLNTGYLLHTVIFLSLLFLTFVYELIVTSVLTVKSFPFTAPEKTRLAFAVPQILLQAAVISIAIVLDCFNSLHMIAATSAAFVIIQILYRFLAEAKGKWNRGAAGLICVMKAAFVALVSFPAVEEDAFFFVFTAILFALSVGLCLTEILSLRENKKESLHASGTAEISA